MLPRGAGKHRHERQRVRGKLQDQEFSPSPCQMELLEPALTDPMAVCRAACPDGPQGQWLCLRKPCPASDLGVLQRSSALEPRNRGKTKGPLPAASSPRTDPGFFSIKLHSHPIIFIPLMCNQWVLVYSCAIITTISFQNIFMIPKRKSACNQLVPILPPPRPRNILSVSVDLPFLDISYE